MSGIVGGGFALFMLASCVAIVSNGASDDGSATADSSSISEPVVEQPVEAPPVEVAPVEPPIVEAPPAPAPVQEVPAPPPVVPLTPSVSYENCDAVRAAGVAPLTPEQPGWEDKFDRDKDGLACEDD